MMGAFNSTSTIPRVRILVTSKFKKNTSALSSELRLWKAFANFMTELNWSMALRSKQQWLTSVVTGRGWWKLGVRVIWCSHSYIYIFFFWTCLLSQNHLWVSHGNEYPLTIPMRFIVQQNDVCIINLGDSQPAALLSVHSDLPPMPGYKDNVYACTFNITSGISTWYGDFSGWSTEARTKCLDIANVVQ